MRTLRFLVRLFASHYWDEKKCPPERKDAQCDVESPFDTVSDATDVKWMAFKHNMTLN